MKPSVPIFLFLFMFCALDLFGQDLIITNSKEELKTKVIEIDEFLVKYKKFDFQVGPIYSIKKSEVFLIIYSNGTREIFNQNQIERTSSDTQSTKPMYSSEGIETNNAQTINRLNRSSQMYSTNPENTQKSISESKTLLKRGDKMVGIGLGTGALLGSSAGGLATVAIPYVSVRFDKVFKQFGENMSLGAGLFAGYHSYSIGGFGSESTLNIISGGLSGSYYYGISEKLAIGAGLRVLYVSIGYSGNSGYDLGPSANIDIDVLGSVYYKVSQKLNLFSEISTGISNINLGVQFHL